MTNELSKRVIVGFAGFICGITCTLPGIFTLKNEVKELRIENQQTEGRYIEQDAIREYKRVMDNLKIDLLVQEVKCLKSYPERVDYENGIVFPCVVPSTHEENMHELELMHRFPKQFIDDILNEMNSM